MMQKLGIVNPYPNDRDKGLAEVTHNPADNFMFKVPSLRGVGQTAPYFHDGATYSLQEVVEQTAWHQMGVRLKKEEVENITAFLQSLNNTASLIPEN
jgi:cytochrome c peroxidase